MAFDVVMSVFNQCFLNKLALAAVGKAKIFFFRLHVFVYVQLLCTANGGGGFYQIVTMT